MKNKGFTLIELLGVIVLLGVLGVVIVPKVGDSITNGKETALNTQKEQIKKAARDFAIDNIQLLQMSDTVSVNVGTLKQNGYLPINIKNPKTKKPISNESQVTIQKNGNNYDVNVSIIDLENVTQDENANLPIIILNGNYIEYVEVGDTYTEKGVVARTVAGETISNVSTQIKKDDVEQGSVNTAILATYKITYSATYSGDTTSVTRTVIVRDSTAPVITFPEITTLEPNQVATFNPLTGVTVTDNYDGSITPEVTSNLSNIAGNYVITYTATDSNGNTAVARRIVTVDAQYTYYDYIESSGTQYINTGYTPNGSTGMELDFAYMGTDSTKTWIVLCGSGNPTVSFWIHRTQLQPTVEYNTYDPLLNTSFPTITVGSRHVMKNVGGTFYFDGVQAASTTSNPGTVSNPIYIFQKKIPGDIDNRQVHMRVFEFKIYQGDALQKDFIPAKRNSDNVIGMLETQTNTFYTNGGSGNFTAGNL